MHLEQRLAVLQANAHGPEHTMAATAGLESQLQASQQKVVELERAVEDMKVKASTTHDQDDTRVLACTGREKAQLLKTMKGGSLA